MDKTLARWSTAPPPAATAPPSPPHTPPARPLPTHCHHFHSLRHTTHDAEYNLKKEGIFAAFAWFSDLDVVHGVVAFIVKP